MFSKKTFVLFFILPSLFVFFQNFTFPESKVPGTRFEASNAMNNPSYLTNMPAPPIFTNTSTVSVIDGEYTAPHIPPYRTTSDGRLGVSMSPIFLKTPSKNIEGLSFKLLIPENVRSPFMLGANGVSTILNEPDKGAATLGYFLPISDLTSKGIKDIKTGKSLMANPRYKNLEALAMVTVCDPPQNRNPAVCGGAYTTECGCGPGTAVSSCQSREIYDVYLISALRTTQEEWKKNQTIDLHLIRIPVRIVVKNAKTNKASIDSIKVTGPVEMAGTSWKARTFFEPMITADGKLLVTRIGNKNKNFNDENGRYLDFDWYNRSTGKMQRGHFDIVFSVNASTGTETACQIDKWNELFPISHAPYHPVTKSRYGFAKLPFRDSSGEAIKDGEDMSWTYPWIDRKGSNLFFTFSGSTLLYKEEKTSKAYRAKYTVACVPGSTCNPKANVEVSSLKRGISMVGLWSLGKIVTLDGQINASDYGHDFKTDNHRMAALYKASSGRFFERVGSGIEISSVVVQQDKNNQLTLNNPSHPAGFTGNSAFMDSVEHLFNYNDNMKPITPRDVVWMMSSGKATDEVVFDDYMNNNALIVSEMTAPFLKGDYLKGEITYGDGFNGTIGIGQGMTATAYVQNAAGTLPSSMAIPKYGYIRKGRDATAGRIEPVAKGGFRGKGLWLSGSNSLVYDLPAQTKEIDRPLYISLMVDNRLSKVKDVQKGLFHLPSGLSAYLSYEGSDENWNLTFTYKGREYPLSQPLQIPFKSWTHLGFRFQVENGDKTRLFVETQGMSRAHIALPLFDFFASGEFIIGALGDSIGGTRAWIDDLKVFAEIPNPEVRCNLAYGTIVGVGRNGTYSDIKNAVLMSWHSEVIFPRKNGHTA